MNEHTTPKIESQDLTVGALFKNFYSVPDFQREYFWRGEQVERHLVGLVIIFTLTFVMLLIRAFSWRGKRCQALQLLSYRLVRKSKMALAVGPMFSPIPFSV